MMANTNLALVAKAFQIRVAGMCALRACGLSVSVVAKLYGKQTLKPT